MAGDIKSSHFFSRMKHSVKSLLRKAIPTRRQTVLRFVIAGSEESLPRGTDTAPTSSPVLPISSAPGVQEVPDTTGPSKIQKSSSGPYHCHQDPELNFWPEPVDGPSDSCATSNGASSNAEGSIQTLPDHEGQRFRLRLRRSASGNLLRSHQVHPSVSSAANAQILSSSNTVASPSLNNAAAFSTSSIPSFTLNGVSTSVDELVSSMSNSERQLATNVSYNIVQFFGLPDPFVEQAATTSDTESVSDNRPWDDISSDEFDSQTPVYLGNGVYRLTCGSIHAINELPQHSGGVYSPPYRPDTPMLTEVIPPSPPALMQPRIAPEIAVRNAEVAIEGLSEIAREAVDDLIDQSRCLWNNSNIYQQLAGRAESSAAMAWTLVTERDAEIAALRYRLENPQEMTPPRPQRRLSFSL